MEIRGEAGWLAQGTTHDPGKDGALQPATTHSAFSPLPSQDMTSKNCHSDGNCKGLLRAEEERGKKSCLTVFSGTLRKIMT